MDTLFSSNQGLYRLANPAMAMEIAIEVVCLTGGPLVIAYLWVNRCSLLTEP